jgi:hypothetical protein
VQRRHGHAALRRRLECQRARLTSAWSRRPIAAARHERGLLGAALGHIENRKEKSMRLLSMMAVIACQTSTDN